MKNRVVIILDGDLKSALSAVRSLGKKNIFVSVGSEYKFSMSSYSKYSKHSFKYVSPISDRALFKRDILNAIENLKKREFEEIIIYTFGDATTLSLDFFKGDLGERVIILSPKNEGFKVSFNKALTVKYATSVGIETPQTFFPESHEELEEVLKRISFPVVLKPRHNVLWVNENGVRCAVKIVNSSEDLVSEFNMVHKGSNEYPIIQEFIKGREYASLYLFKNKNVVASFAHKRIRSLSPKGGASVVKESIEENFREIGKMGEKILKALDWEGPAMVEWKIDERDGKPKLIEINGRFWGALPLAIFAGVDFPYLSFKAVLSESFEKPEYKKDLASRHFLGDVKNLISNILEKYPKKVLAIKNFFDSSSMKDDVYEKGDIIPSLIEPVMVIFKKIK